MRITCYCRKKLCSQLVVREKNYAYKLILKQSCPRKMSTQRGHVQSRDVRVWPAMLAITGIKWELVRSQRTRAN
jgi:hypothetical protein